MKAAARKIVERILWRQVSRLQKKNSIKIIAVAGSLGKTSTKFAIARTLGSKYKVQFQEGNYNVPVALPLVFFGMELPSLFNPIAWLKTFIKIELQLNKKYPYDIVILELGTDGPGQLEEFVPRLSADIGILTAIAPEHMEFFHTLDAVAKEELTLAKLSKRFIYNKDRCDDKYMQGFTGVSYGIDRPADLKLENLKLDDGYGFDVYADGQLLLSANVNLIAKHQLYAAAAAIAAAQEMGLSQQETLDGLKSVSAVNGRMQKLKGINDSTLIDDTYNASPEAVLSALDTLYSLKADRKIAVLGNMNELGEYSKQAHIRAGEYCNPKEISLVVTIGPDANNYLASAAEAKGCRVIRFDDPYTIGDYLKTIIQKGDLLLFKGSQNGVFAEEAVKAVLADPSDNSKLVRQSEYWLKRKKKSFKREQK